MKKKLMVLVLVLALVAALSVGLVACGNKGGGGTDGANNTCPDVKIGAIYITSQSDAAGYTYAHNNGIRKAMKDLGMPDTKIAIQDNIPEDQTAVGNAIDALIGQGCNMIIGISFGYNEAMEIAANKPEYSGIVFSHATGDRKNDTNFNNYFGRIYQARYLSGIAAGLKSLEVGNNTLGFVAAYGTEYAETCSGINAFALGAQSVNPNAVVKVYQLDTWGNEQLEQQGAQVLIDTFGCGIIAQHCDSAQPQLVAAEKGKFGCGYNSDMTKQAPTGHLTAPIWNWNIYYKLAIQAAQKALVAGSTQTYVQAIGGKEWYGGLTEGIIDVSPLSQNCSAGTADAIAKVKDMMIAWEKNNAAENGFGVFDGTKLNIRIKDGVATIQKVNAALGDLVKNHAWGAPCTINAGDAYCGDLVVKATMNQFVAGVELVQKAK